jgi:serine-type D-Ala-D-Ala carboxypeptidase/endopeptidase
MMKGMLVACAVVSVWEVLAYGEGPASSASRGQLDQAISQIGGRYLESNSGVGISIGVVAGGREHICNLGTTDRDKNQPPTEATVYEIGSLSKTFTALLLAQAVLDRKVELDAPVGQYLTHNYGNLSYDGEAVRVVHRSRSWCRD